MTKTQLNIGYITFLFSRTDKMIGQDGNPPEFLETKGQYEGNNLDN